MRGQSTQLISYMTMCKTSIDNISDSIPLFPIKVQLVVIRRCNLSCSYCNEFDGTSDSIPVSQLYSRINKLKQLQTQELELTGGEPLLHQDIANLVAYSKGRGFARVMVKTNGFLITKQIIEALNNAGLDGLQISVDTVKPNPNTKKALNLLKPKLEVLAHCAKFHIRMSATIGSSSLDELLVVRTFAQDHGFSFRVLLRHGEDGQINLSPTERQPYEQRIKDIIDLLDEGDGYKLKLIRGLAAEFMCRAGSRYLYVDEYGIVRWCSQQKRSFGKILFQYTNDDLKQQFYTKKPCSLYCTLGCARTCSLSSEGSPQFLD